MQLCETYNPLLIGDSFGNILAAGLKLVLIADFTLSMITLFIEEFCVSLKMDNPIADPFSLSILLIVKLLMSISLIAQEVIPYTLLP